MSTTPPGDESARPPVTPSPPHPLTRSSSRWVWFFILLAVLAPAGSGTLIWFNLRQQLRADQLAEARRRWQEKGPRDYVLA